MPEPETAHDPEHLPMLIRAEVATRVIARLEGRMTDAQLARWAFDRFYQIELGAERCEPGYEELIEAALDELMFGDEPDFQLGEAELRGLVMRLEML